MKQQTNGCWELHGYNKWGIYTIFLRWIRISTQMPLKLEKDRKKNKKQKKQWTWKGGSPMETSWKKNQTTDILPTICFKLRKKFCFHTGLWCWQRGE